MATSGHSMASAPRQVRSIGCRWANERKAQRLIKSLKDKGYITVEIDKKDDSRVIRVTGKYRHLDDAHMHDLAALRADLIGSMRKR